MFFFFKVTSNLVNYKSFGFTKFIPRIPSEKFEAVVKHSENSKKALELWGKVGI
jgi:dipeptidyl-peptidase III